MIKSNISHPLADPPKVLLHHIPVQPKLNLFHSKISFVAVGFTSVDFALEKRKPTLYHSKALFLLPLILASVSFLSFRMRRRAVLTARLILFRLLELLKIFLKSQRAVFDILRLHLSFSMSIGTLHGGAGVAQDLCMSKS